MAEINSRAADVSTAGMRIIRLLMGNPPQTMTQLIRSTGVTRTAVTEQLNELVASGFVERSTEHLQGRGRPRHLFRTTEAALLLFFPRDQQLAVSCLWKAIEDVGGEELRTKILRKFGRILAEHYNRRVTAKKPEERLRQFADVLCKEGSLIEAKQTNSHLTMFKRSCPFICLTDDKHSICVVDQDMMTHIIGRPVRRIASRHDGAPCCTVEIVPPRD
jgi:predicted ArsR family transcriptional regulator